MDVEEAPGMQIGKGAVDHEVVVGRGEAGEPGVAFWAGIYCWGVRFVELLGCFDRMERTDSGVDGKFARFRCGDWYIVA